MYESIIITLIIILLLGHKGPVSNRSDIEIQKALYVNEGIDAKSPRQALQKAYMLGWLDDENLWLGVLLDRNLTSHTYHEDVAWGIYEKLPAYYTEFKKLYDRLIANHQKQPSPF